MFDVLQSATRTQLTFTWFSSSFWSVFTNEAWLPDLFMCQQAFDFICSWTAGWCNLGETHTGTSSHSWRRALFNVLSTWHWPFSLYLSLLRSFLTFSRGRMLCSHCKHVILPSFRNLILSFIFVDPSRSDAFGVKLSFNFSFSLCQWPCHGQWF